MDEKEYKKGIDAIAPLWEILKKYQDKCKKEDQYFYLEFFIWAMVEFKILDRTRKSDKIEFEDNLIR